MCQAKQLGSTDHSHSVIQPSNSANTSHAASVMWVSAWMYVAMLPPHSLVSDITADSSHNL
jgi:hypothetical protein